MARSATITAKKAPVAKSERPPLISAEKGNELLGVLLITLGLLLGLSLVTYHPADPSLFYHPAEDAGTRNLIGPVGAQLSAVLFGFLGLTAFMLPLLLLGVGVRRFRGQLGTTSEMWSRGFGALVVLITLPGLMQLVLGEISWRGGELAAGGGFGTILAQALEGQLNFLGSLLVLVAAVVAGATLMVQTTLGEILAALRLRLEELWRRFSLVLARRRERREKELARRRVVSKHLQRAAEARRQLTETAEPPPPEVILPALPEGAPARTLPLRVTERKGSGGEYTVRRVTMGEEDYDDLPKSRAEKAVPQKSLPFAEPVTPGALPPLNLLNLNRDSQKLDEDELVRLGELIRSRCAEFGVEGHIAGIAPGPVITVFEFQPAPGVKVSQIVNLQDDLALALKADSVRIDRMAGRSTLGIELPNAERSVIRLGTLFEHEQFQNARSPLTLALGTTIGGQPYYADLATMPHLLVAGATGAGKSVGLQSMITSILYKATRDDVQFIFIDPKRIELGVYADIPHLKAEVVVDPKKAANALQWAVGEMERRYRLLAEVHVRNIAQYNQAIRDPEVQRRLALSDEDAAGEMTDQDLKKLPYYVVIIDELADLMMVSSSEVETCIARLAQMARAVGIHLIIATQRPSVDVLTGTIKANFPCRISYATATRHDSRTILDAVGAERLLGRGDALFMPPGTSRVIRLHGAFMSEQETAGLVRWLKKQGRPDLDPMVLLEGTKSSTGGGGAGDEDEDDPLFDEASRLVISEGQASASFLQRRMRIGFARAGRLIDMMERDGLLGPPQGSKPREVLVKPDYFQEIDQERME